MLTASAQFKSQDPPRILPPSHRTDNIRGALLGNSGLQVISLEVSTPNFPRAEGRRAFRRSARTNTTRRDAGNGAERARLEFGWLAANQQRYAGRWIALEGNKLLAVGDSAQEVYRAIANREGIPLVTRVEPEGEVYFAGW